MVFRDVGSYPKAVGRYQNPDQRAVISWIGGGIVVVGGGIWTVVKFFAERKKPDEKKGGGTKVIQSGQGNASGRDTIIGRDAIYGADGRQIGQAVARRKSPFSTGMKSFPPRTPN